MFEALILVLCNKYRVREVEVCRNASIVQSEIFNDVMKWNNEMKYITMKIKYVNIWKANFE